MAGLHKKNVLMSLKNVTFSHNTTVPLFIFFSIILGILFRSTSFWIHMVL